MSWRVFTFILFIYIIIVMLSGIMSEAYFGSNETTIVDYLIRPETPTYTNPIGGITSTFAVSAGFITALFKAIFLDLPIFYGEYQIVRILILTVAMGAIIYLVVLGPKQ